MTLDAPAMTKASASNTENLRGIEAVVSVDRVSSSEGAEGPDILTAALWLVGSGADTTFGTAELEAVSALGQTRLVPPVLPTLDFRYALLATEIARRCNLSLRS
jgi:hypothetical protein